MSSSHMKRLTMPRTWPLPRKTDVWVQKPDPSGHPLELCMPMAVGLMDVLTVGEDNYRCVLDTNGKLRYRPIAKKEAGTKLCRVINKTTIKGGKTQYTLHDGRTIISEKPDEYSTGDSLSVSLPDQEIQAHHPFKPDSIAYLIGGSHVGEVSKIKTIEVKRSTRPNEVSFEEFGTIASYAFVIPSETALPLEAKS